MQFKTICLSLGLGLAAVASASAADLDYGGSIKDRGGVLVPAPIPVPETFRWYLRADVGGGISSKPSVREQGMIFGLDRDPAVLPANSFGSDSSWFSSHFNDFATGSIGAGAYITPRLRADLTVDVRQDASVKGNGTYNYFINPTLVPSAAGPVQVDGTQTDTVQIRTVVTLANLYWDLVDRNSRFVPYVGVGAGFAARTLNRTNMFSENDIDVTAGTTTTQSGTTHSNATRFVPAFAATAGVGYALSPGMVLDVSYRFTYIDGVDISTPVNYHTASGAISTTTSKMSLGETTDHVIRAGIRWNIW
ncbi:MAG: outer membrane beta-barrel protein [Proteobacteria bacterium]|nr:outer membrane beta-barrel protein [Pseudomonadota bacterium]